jgi:hypothetical protein
MRRVLSFMALVLVSLVTAVGMLLAAPSVAFGAADPNLTALALAVCEC